MTTLLSDVQQPFYRVTDFGIGEAEYSLIKSWFDFLSKKNRKCFIVRSLKKYKRGMTGAYSCWVFGTETINDWGVQNGEKLPDGYEVIATHGCKLTEVRVYLSEKEVNEASMHAISSEGFVMTPSFAGEATTQ